MLEVISRLELSVPHGIFFHPHKCGIRICLGITVTGTTDIPFLCIFFQFFQVFLQCLDALLQEAFSLPCAMDEFDPFRFFQGIQFSARFFYLFHFHLAVVDQPDPVKFFAAFHKGCQFP